MGFLLHVKMHLFDVRGWWAMDLTYYFFKFYFMTKQRIRAYNMSRTVKVSQLAQPLNAGIIRQGDSAHDINERYGTEVRKSIPGSAQHWKSFRLDLTSFVAQRGLPDFFVTKTAHDRWSTISRGWGAEPKSVEFRDLADNVDNPQAVGRHPHVCVLAAEKRCKCMMNILLSADGSPLGCVEDYCWKKEYQKRRAVHWYMLFWVTSFQTHPTISLLTSGKSCSKCSCMAPASTGFHVHSPS